MAAANKDKDKDKDAPPTPPEDAPTPPPEKPKRVEVIHETGVLGHKLLRKGEVTDDADYVALLDTEGGDRFVREVK